MTKKKSNLYGLVVAIVLALAAINFSTLNQATAAVGGEGNQQYVATTCTTSGARCNNCNSGTNTCTDHTCSQCRNDTVAEAAGVE